MSSHEVTVFTLAAQAYSDGYTLHGDIDLDRETFENGVHVVIEKHLGPDAPDSARLSFLRTLHTNDLYLAAACAQASEQAWRRFVAVYQKHINDVARFVARSDLAYELANNVLTDLFMPGRSGRSRIASFDGRESLGTWLRAVINHRAINQGLLKWNTFDSIDRAAEVADNSGIRRIEASIRGSRYESILPDAFERSIQSLTDRERLLLVLRYEDGLRIVEIAEVLRVHPSGVTRQLRQICLKLQKKIISVLALRHHLGPAAIRECVLDLLENPAYSLLEVLKASESARMEQSVVNQ